MLGCHVENRLCRWNGGNSSDPTLVIQVVTWTSSSCGGEKCGYIYGSMSLKIESTKAGSRLDTGYEREREVKMTPRFGA